MDISSAWLSDLALATRSSPVSDSRSLRLSETSIPTENTSPMNSWEINASCCQESIRPNVPRPWIVKATTKPATATLCTATAAGLNRIAAQTVGTRSGNATGTAVARSKTVR